MCYNVYCEFLLFYTVFRVNLFSQFFFVTSLSFLIADIYFPFFTLLKECSCLKIEPCIS